MQIKHFIGIDVSKNTLDFSVVIDGKNLQHYCIKNSAHEIKSTVNKIIKSFGATVDDTVFCMEHTGLYNLPLVKWLQSYQGKMWLESGVHIRKTLGLVRGKNDKVDSARIAMYAYINRHQVKLWKAPRKLIERIAALLSQRSRLNKAKKQLTTANQEQKQFIDKDIMISLNRYTSKTVVVINKQIEAIETEILGLIKEDKKLNRMYQIITSVHGIGFVTASYILVTTNEFININNPKKYACYSGVVPFEHSSGSSVRGKTRVSQMANKNIKTLLHLAALSTIQVQGDLQEYYNRKVSEGKNKMSVLNAIRNKLILRIFACVNQNREYEKIYSYKFV
ncbi:MAG TPA: IS110 family transposase [Bacteroidales bacterium]